MADLGNEVRELAPEMFAGSAVEVAPDASEESLYEQITDARARAAGMQEMQAADALPAHVRNELKTVETEIKYAGYLLQQQRAIDRLKRAEERSIPSSFDYTSVSGLSREMKEKLMHVRPATIGQASQIPGVTPAALSLVNVYIEIQAKRAAQ